MPIVLGTAGHIDHGKTALVNAITGIDCDRLAEEKKRGITIELGFAHMLLPNGELLGIIDVPGHERFVKNMVSGASGIDFVMLVISAEEGVMPQTREHLDICSILGIKHGLVVLTKIDMVDQEWLELAIEDTKDFLKNSFLEHAPIFTVSSLTGLGIDKLKQYIFEQTQNISVDKSVNIFRLPIDRVFTMKGHGTVITGTIISGKVELGEELALMPSSLVSRVRSIQVHGKAEPMACAGQRCAINLQNVDVANVERGQVLTHINTIFPAKSWLVQLKCLASAPRALRNRTEIHFHHGSKEVLAKLYFFDRDKLKAGETTLTEIRFNTDMVGFFGDRFVIRSFSPLHTVAGGTIINPCAYILRRKSVDFLKKYEILGELEKIAKTDVERLVFEQINLAENTGLYFDKLIVLTQLANKALEKILQNLCSKKMIYCYDREEKAYISIQALQDLKQLCMEKAQAFHEKEPLKANMARAVVTAGWSKDLPLKLVHIVVERNLKDGLLVLENDGLRAANHKVALVGKQSDLRQKILDAHIKAGLTPPNFKEVLEQLDADLKEVNAVLAVLLAEKLLVKVKDNMYYDFSALDTIKQKVKCWFETNDDLSLADLKEVLNGMSRKYLIALIEYLDREKFTMRIGDKRQWRGRGRE